MIIKGGKNTDARANERQKESGPEPLGEKRGFQKTRPNPKKNCRHGAALIKKGSHGTSLFIGKKIDNKPPGFEEMGGVFQLGYRGLTGKKGDCPIRVPKRKKGGAIRSKP